MECKITDAFASGNNKLCIIFDAHVTVHRDKFRIIKPTRLINFYMFRTVPLSIVRSMSLYTQQWYMSYRFADSLLGFVTCLGNCTTYRPAVLYGTETFFFLIIEPTRCTNYSIFLFWNETCRVSFQSKNEKLMHLVSFILRNLSLCTVT